MYSSPRWWLFQAFVLALATGIVCAQGTSKPADPAKNATPREPGAVLLTPEKYKELLDQIDKLKKQASPEPPSSCKIAGRVDGNIVHLTVEFEFRTLQPRTLVALGCQKAQLSAAVLDDGRLPLLPPPGEEGYVVQVETPGQHRVVLTMDLPVTAKETDRSLDLNLPRAAINILDHFEIPGALSDVRVISHEDKRQFQQVVPAHSLRPGNDQRKPLALGAISKLEVAWRVPAPPPTGEPVREVRGDVEVRVDDNYITTRADLTLKLRSGQTDHWRILAPASTVMEPVVPAGEKPPTVTPPSDAKLPIWTLKGEPANKALQLTLRIRQLRTGKIIPVGPFAVLNAERQQGTISVIAPADVRLRYHLRGDISQSEVPEERRQEGNVVASFTYYSLPVPVKPKDPVLTPLDLEIEAIKGAVETRVFHTLKFLPRQGWRITTRLEVTPVRTTVDQVVVELPAGYQEVRPPSAALVEDVEIKEATGQRRLAYIKLAERYLSGRTFQLILEGLHPLPREAAEPPTAQPQRLQLGLPLPLETQDRGAEITAEVPEGLELVVPESGSDTPRSGPRPIAWRLDRAPAQVDLSWREYRPDLPVNSDIDLTLTDRHARIRHRLRFPSLVAASASTGRAELRLRVPVALAGRVTVVEGYKMAPTSEARTVWSVVLPEPGEREGSERGEQTVTLQYDFPLPEPDRETRACAFTVPLVWAEQATGGSTKVWVWSDPGVRVQALSAGDRWDELPTELTPERPDRLPALVLRCSSLAVPLLSLKLEPAEVPPTVVERVLIQASVGDWGAQTYRARFLITRLTSRSLEVELPAPPASINLGLLWDNRRVTLQTVDESGSESDVGRIVRFSVDPDPGRLPALLDVHYQLVSGRDAERPSGWRPITLLQPPILRGRVFVWEKRWSVRLPGGALPLYAGDGSVMEQRWDWRGWLPGPRPAMSSAELEAWFTGGDPETRPEEEPSLVCRQSAVRPLSVVEVPQQAWLLGCSLLVFAAGFALYFLPLSRGQFWGVVVGLVVLLPIAAVLWPGVLPALVYGCEPALLVLALVFVYAWVRQRRYRRQVVFMPGFSRLKAGSSLVRSKPGDRPRREPSTVDVAPPGSGS